MSQRSSNPPRESGNSSRNGIPATERSQLLRSIGNNPELEEACVMSPTKRTGAPPGGLAGSLAAQKSVDGEGLLEDENDIENENDIEQGEPLINEERNNGENQKDLSIRLSKKSERSVRSGRTSESVKSDSTYVSIPEENKASFWGTVANQILLALGTGILSMPKNQAASGILTAILVLAFCLFLNYVSVMLIIKAADRYNCFELEKILKKHLPYGRVWYYTCLVATYFTFGAALITYLIAFSDAGVQFSASFQNEKIWDLDKRVSEFHVSKRDWNPASFDTQAYINKILNAWMSPMTDSGVLTIGTFRLSNVFFKLIAGVLVFPLCFLSQKWLGYFSMASIGVNIFILISVIINFALEYKNLKGHPEGVWAAQPDLCLFGMGTGPIGFVSSCMMAMSVQPCMVPMYQELKDRSVEKFARSMKYSSAFIFVLFVLFCQFAHLTYGDELQGNVLLNMSGRWYSYINSFGIMLVLLTIYPLTLYPMKNGIRSAWGKLAMTIGLIIGSLILSLFFAGLDQINNICGASASFFFLAFFPSLIAIYILDLNKVSYWLFIIFGASMMILGFIFPTADIKWRQWNQLTSLTWYTTTEAKTADGKTFDVRGEEIIPLYPEFHRSVVDLLAPGPALNGMEKFSKMISDAMDGNSCTGSKKFSKYKNGVVTSKLTDDKDEEVKEDLDKVTRAITVFRLIQKIDKNIKEKIEYLTTSEVGHHGVGLSKENRETDIQELHKMRALIFPEFRDSYIAPEYVEDLPLFVLKDYYTAKSSSEAKNSSETKSTTGFINPFHKFTEIDQVITYLENQIKVLIGLEKVQIIPDYDHDAGKTVAYPLFPDLNDRLRKEFLEGSVDHDRFLGEISFPRFDEADTYYIWRQEVHGNYKDRCLWRASNKML